MVLTNILAIISISFISSFLISFFLFLLLRNRDVKASHEKDDYIAMLVHDIRSPLTVIRGSADLMLHESKDLSKADTEKLLKQIKDTSDVLLSMVTDILDVSKMESGRFEIIKTPSDLNLLLKGITDRFIVVANQNSIKLDTNLDTSIPKVELDPEKIERVVNNLLSNAIKFTPENGQITVTSSVEEDLVKVSVSDTGIGIDDNMKTKLFNKFVQAGKTMKSSGSASTGLGLKVSKEIVELHKGKIWIEDNKPKGSVFVFTLPLNLPKY